MVAQSEDDRRERLSLSRCPVHGSELKRRAGGLECSRRDCAIAVRERPDGLEVVAGMPPAERMALGVVRKGKGRATLTLAKLSGPRHRMLMAGRVGAPLRFCDLQALDALLRARAMEPIRMADETWIAEITAVGRALLEGTEEPEVLPDLTAARRLVDWQGGAAHVLLVHVADASDDWTDISLADVRDLAGMTAIASQRGCAWFLADQPARRTEGYCSRPISRLDGSRALSGDAVS